MPLNKTIDTSLFDKASVHVQGLAGQFLDLFFFNTSGSYLGYRRQAVTTNDQVIDFDMSVIGAGSGNWAGTVGAIRVDVGQTSGKTGCVGWVSIGSSNTATEPAIPTVQKAAGKVVADTRSMAPINMPDEKGGADYFSDRGNLADFNSADTYKTLEILEAY